MVDYYNIMAEGQDLVEAAKGSRPPYFRDREIQAAVDTLTTKRRPVLLVGPAGVGKTAVLHGVARRLNQETGAGLRSFTTAQILSGTRYLGDWQSKLTRLMTESEESNVVLNVVDAWNLATAGTSINSKECFLDAMRPRLGEGRLRLISEATADQLQDMSRVSRFAALFEVIPIEPLSDRQHREIVACEARNHHLSLPQDASDRLFELCDSFSSIHSGPGPVLDLLNNVRDYRDQKLAVGEEAELTSLFIEKVFSIHSGLPLFVVSRSENKSSSQIREWFGERIIGQEAAIDAVVEMIAFYKARLHDKSKPIGSFLFVGPTGVGKTELARTLAEFFFGSERRMLRFDMSEFADYNSFEMLIGSPQTLPERPARLVDPVRLQPFQVLLFDELEKAHRNVQDLFLQLLDEGRLTTPRGETVSFRNTIMIATSNVGSFEGMTSSIGFGDKGGDYDADKALQAIELNFRPEFLNRFQHVVLFHPLTRDQAMRIARIDLQSVLRREGIAGRNLIVDVHDNVIEHVLAAGFDPRYGGRAIKRVIRRQIILPLATLLMERSLEPGSLIELRMDDGRVRIRVADTPDTRQAKAERAPIRTQTGDRLTREGIRDRIAAARTACETLVAAADLNRLRNEIEKIEADRKNHLTWHDAEAAARLLAQQTHMLETVTRVERLNERVDELAGSFEPRTTRTALAQLADGLLQLEAAIAVARREIVAMGPDGYWDALIEIAPIGPSIDARDFLFELYGNWARGRRLALVMLHEPMTSHETIAIALRGHFAYGYLKGEAGHHRVRRQRESSVARVCVAPLSNRAGPVEFGEQRPLKAIGQLRGKIRSRVAILGSRLVLQNAHTLSENRELARDIAPSWPREQPPTMPTVRRYDLEPFLVRDYLTGSSFTRGDILGFRPFHGLLCARIDQSVQGDSRDTEATG